MAQESSSTLRAACAPCAAAYDAMVEGARARSRERRARTIDEAGSSPDTPLAARVRAFARCARRERLRPELVLRALREALQPLATADVEAPDVRAMIRWAADDYYAARTSLDPSASYVLLRDAPP